jgi:hypothetical protein
MAAKGSGKQDDKKKPDTPAAPPVVIKDGVYRKTLLGSAQPKDQ